MHGTERSAPKSEIEVFRYFGLSQSFEYVILKVLMHFFSGKQKVEFVESGLTP